MGIKILPILGVAAIKKIYKNLPVILSLGISALIFLMVLFYSRFGFDLTDEGYYLNWISRPRDYVPSVTLFGFLYHPIYLFLGGDIVLLRLVNVGGTFILAGYSGWLILGATNNYLPFGPLLRLAISASFATCALTAIIFNGLWLYPTPSYNWAVFQGLLIVLIGLLVSESLSKRNFLIGGVLIGFGFWFTFMGKPSSAALLALTLIIYKVFIGKLFSWQSLIISFSATTLFLLTATIIDGSIAAFIDRNILGWEMAKILHGSSALPISSFFRLEPFNPVSATLAASCYVFFLTLASIWISKFHPKTYSDFGSLLGIVLSSAGTYYIFFLKINLNSIPAPNRGLLFVVIAVGAILSLLLFSGFRGCKILKRSDVMLIVVLIFFPYVYAFGTGNNYWVSITATIIFILFACMIVCTPYLLSDTIKKSFLGAGFIIQFTSTIFLMDALGNPYRGIQPIPMNDVDITIGNRDSLRVVDSQSRYLINLGELAKRFGFKKGTPMIDLTGQSPGALYYLGAKSVGLSWTLGGYPGSTAFVDKALSYMSCDELARSWILIEPGGPRSISSEVIKSFAADIISDYHVTGSVLGPNGLPQYILIPSRNMNYAVNACRMNRGSANE